MAYECTKDVLAQLGFPVADLTFDDPDLACRGLVIDTERGNFLKIDRHGFVRRAMHGSVRLNASEIDVLYGRSQISLRDRRFSFLNTLFSVSEGVLYSQLVSKLDSGALVRDSSPPFDASRVAKYADLHRAVTKALSRAHGGSSTPSVRCSSPSSDGSHTHSRSGTFAEAARRSLPSVMEIFFCRRRRCRWRVRRVCEGVGGRMRGLWQESEAAPSGSALERSSNRSSDLLTTTRRSQ